jgi:citrate lyase subunit gamma (acyl carrier protein)
MKSFAGTYESSDCFIRVSPFDETKIQIESSVMEQFGDAILKVISNTLKQYNVQNVFIECFDKGALDYTIKSRLTTALRRGGYIE